MTNSSGGGQSDLIVLLHALQQRLRESRASLEAQQHTLQEHGVRLPPGMLTTLDDIAREVETGAMYATQLQQAHDQYRALAGIAALVNSSLDVSDVLNRAMDTIVALAGAERGYLMLRDANTGELSLRAAHNVDAAEALEGEAFAISRSVVQRVLATGTPVLTTNAQEDRRFRHAASIAGYSLRSILCVPLVAKGELIGVLYADNRMRAGLFSEQTRDLLMAFADQAAVALENARLFEQTRAALDAATAMKSLQDNIFTSIVSGVITTDLEERVTMANRRAQQILGVDDQSVQGVSLRALLPPMGERFEILLRQAREGATPPAGVEFELEIPAGTKVTLSLSISALRDAHNDVQGLTVVLDDLTETRQREAQIAGVRRYLPIEVVDGISSADPLKLGGTEATVTILFADIRNFSSFSRQVSPEALVAVANRYMTLASDAIHQQEGVIDKFLGDAVMALYNTPLRPQADHALRAVRSAALLLSDVRAHHEVVPASERLDFGIGIHTGPAVVGNVGSVERLNYTAMGDSVNLAKRLQEMARPWQVLLSEETYHEVRDHVEVSGPRAAVVKGRSEPVLVYDLQRVF